MPVPEALDWPAAGGMPEVFTTAHDALFTQAGLRPGERLLVHGGAGRRRAPRPCSSAPPPARASPRRCATADAARRRRARSAPREVARPRGLRRARPLRRRARARRRAEPRAATCKALAHGRAHRRHRRRRRVQGRAQPAGAHGQARPLTGSTLRARPLEEKALTARAMERHVLPLLAAGRCACRSRRRSRSTRSQAAYERFAAGGKLGKIVLLLGARPRAGPRRASSGRRRRARPRPRATEQSVGPPVSSTTASSRSVSLAPHSSQRSPARSSVRSSRSMAARLSVRRQVGVPVAEHAEGAPEGALGGLLVERRRRCSGTTSASIDGVKLLDDARARAPAAARAARRGR